MRSAAAGLAVARKLEAARAGVNRRGQGRVRVNSLCAAALMFVLVGAGCTRPIRPAPVEPSTVWPTVLGEATRNGYEGEAVADEQPVDVWRTEVGRGLRAAPVVTGPVVLLATTNRMVTALSAETGEIFWEQRLSGTLTVQPLVDGDRIFVATATEDAEVYALRLRDGRTLWKRKLPQVREAPLLLENVLYVGTQTGRVLALEVEEKGALRWEARLGASTASTPVAWNGHIAVGTGRDSLVFLDARDGRGRERVALPGEVSAPPALVGDTLILPFYSGELLALELVAVVEPARPGDGGRRNGSGAGRGELWRVRLGAPILAAPVAAEDGKVYVLTRDGEIWAVARGAGDATHLASLGGVATASLVLAGRTLVAGLLDGRLVAVDRGTGATRWSVRFEDSVHAPVAVHSGAIFVPLLRGTVVKLR